MKKYLTALTLLFAFCAQLWSQANTLATVTGRVTDENNEPIPGASILVKGTRTGISTNMEGEFTLNVKGDKVTLEVSFIGMKKKTLKVDATQKKALEITLETDVKTLDDVVVTGYGNVRKTGFTGATTQISGEELRTVSQTNILDALQVFDPSFRLMTNTLTFGNTKGDTIKKNPVTHTSGEPLHLQIRIYCCHVFYCFICEINAFSFLRQYCRHETQIYTSKRKISIGKILNTENISYICITK